MRRTAVVAAAALALLAVSSCSGGGRDAASQRACTQAAAILKQYDQYRGFAPEIRAEAAQAMGPALAQAAQPATGAVRTAIQHLADAANGLNLNTTTQLVTALQPQLDTYDSRIAAARPAFESACK